MPLAGGLPARRVFEPPSVRVRAGVYLIRVRLPQRRGSLAAVATCLGEAGANISRLQVRTRDEHGALVDFLVELLDDAGLQRVVRGLDALEDVRVQWVDPYPSGGGLHYDLEVLERMSSGAGTAEQVLVTAAPLLCQAAWALLLDETGRHVRFRTALAPDPTADELAALRPSDGAQTLTQPGDLGAVVAVVPLPPDATLVVGRPDGPAFTAAELARLEYLAAARGCPSCRRHLHPPSRDADG